MPFSGHNANVERIFSLIVVPPRTKERNRLQIETVESIVQCKFNFNITSSEYHTYITGKPEKPETGHKVRKI